MLQTKSCLHWNSRPFQKNYAHVQRRSDHGCSDASHFKFLRAFHWSIFMRSWERSNHGARMVCSRCMQRWALLAQNLYLPDTGYLFLKVSVILNHSGTKRGILDGDTGSGDRTIVITGVVDDSSWCGSFVFVISGNFVENAGIITL